MTGVLRTAVALSLAVGLLAACAGRRAVRHPQTTSQITLSPGDVRFTRIAEGEDCVKQVLGVQLSTPSFQAAQQRALTSAAAEHLLNQLSSDGIEMGFFLPNPLVRFTGSSRHALFVFYGQHCVYVEGHGVSRSLPDRPVALP